MVNKVFFNKRVFRLVVVSVLLACLLGVGYPAPLQRIRAAPSMKGRITVDITSVEYDATYKASDGTLFNGMLVHVYLECGNLKGTPVRFGIFYFWDNDDPMLAGSNAPNDFVTKSGYLTWQDVVSPHYNESEWKDIQVFIPYAFFPSIDQASEGYVIAEAGLDGQTFTRYGARNYFTLNP